MHGVPVGQGGSRVDRRAHQGVTKAHPGADLEQARHLRWRGRFHAQSEPLARPQQQDWIAKLRKKAYVKIY